MIIEQLEVLSMGRSHKCSVAWRTTGSWTSPEVEIARNELSALIDPDRFRKSELPADVFEDLDNIGPAEVEPRFDRRRVARERVDDRQDAQLPAGRKLV